MCSDMTIIILFNDRMILKYELINIENWALELGESRVSG